jgi:hypothetical protein
MIMTKIVFNSENLSFNDWDEFTLYGKALLGNDTFTELAYVLTDQIVEGKILPFEKYSWSGNVGYIQKYHRDALEAKDFQLFLIKNATFIEMFEKLRTVEIAVKIEMLASDTPEGLNESSPMYVDVTDSLTPVRSK